MKRSNRCHPFKFEPRTNGIMKSTNGISPRNDNRKLYCPHPHQIPPVNDLPVHERSGAAYPNSRGFMSFTLVRFIHTSISRNHGFPIMSPKKKLFTTAATSTSQKVTFLCFYFVFSVTKRRETFFFFFITCFCCFFFFFFFSFSFSFFLFEDFWLFVIFLWLIVKWRAVGGGWGWSSWSVWSNQGQDCSSQSRRGDNWEGKAALKGLSDFNVDIHG